MAGAVGLFPRLVAEEAAGHAGGKVRVLPPEVAHRIAAGEVIERPASAVKELVENALDAGASRVEVDIVDGGISAVRVRDDGHGMSPGDAGRAVAEHATSKIRTADDLDRVESPGFRGEALHAIGSVSHLPLMTNSPEVRGPGLRVRVLAGATVEAGPASHPPSTTVEARELFLNLPVRRGFLGTVRAEAKPVATAALARGLPPYIGKARSWPRAPEGSERMRVGVSRTTRRSIGAQTPNNHRRNSQTAAATP